MARKYVKFASQALVETSNEGILCNYSVYHDWGPCLLHALPSPICEAVFPVCISASTNPNLLRFTFLDSE